MNPLYQDLFSPYTVSTVPSSLAPPYTVSTAPSSLAPPYTVPTAPPSMTLLEFNASGKLQWIPKITSALQKIEAAMKDLRFVCEGKMTYNSQARISEAKQALKNLMFSHVALGNDVPIFSESEIAQKIYLNHLAERAEDVLNYREPAPKPIYVIAAFIAASVASVIAGLHLLFGNLPVAGLIGLGTAFLIKGMLTNRNHDELLKKIQEVESGCQKTLAISWS